MRLKIILLLFLINCSYFVHAQNYYKIEDLPITWVNFKKESKSAARNTVAQTVMNTQVSYESTITNDLITLKITMSLEQDKEKSWVSKSFLMKSNDETTHSTLNHER